MSNVSQSVGRKLLSTLRNENLIVQSYGSLGSSVYLVNAKNGHTFGTVMPSASNRYEWSFYTPDNQKHYQSYEELVADIKQCKDYPAPKVRVPRMVAKARRTPRTCGVSMGRFVPGLLSPERDS